MRNNRNDYDRVGSSQDFSNNEGYHNYQDRARREFRNNPQFSDSQRSQYDDGMSRSEGNNYRADSAHHSGKPSSLNADRFESRYGSDFAWASREQNQPRDGRSFDRYDASMSGSDPYQPRSSANYGSGSSQSERFDARYNSDYGYGAHDDHHNESRFNSGLGQTAVQRTSKQGPHFGKAPKGYKRSDERIREDVCEALGRHSDIDATEIEVDVKDGIVTLSGTVDSRHVKRLTEDEIEHMPGVIEVKNDLRILASADLSKPRWGSAENSMGTGSKAQSGKSSTSSGKSVQ